MCRANGQCARRNTRNEVILLGPSRSEEMPEVKPTRVCGRNKGVTGNLDTDDPRRKQAQKLCLFGSHQYSDGRSSVVALRSASVMIQSLVPFERVYAESSQKP